LDSSTFIGNHLTAGHQHGTPLPADGRAKEATMKRILLIVGLLFGLATGVASAQTRVGVSLSFGDPYLAGQVVIGRPHYYRYYPYAYYRYRPFSYAPRVIIVRPHRYYVRRRWSRHRGW
jgi:hypothetical protein